MKGAFSFWAQTVTFVGFMMGAFTFDVKAGDPHTVGLWHFQTGAFEKVKDASDNGFHGELIGGVEWTDDGKFGRALRFDGGYVEIPKNKALDLTEFTVELWFWAESIVGEPVSGGEQAVFAHGESFDTDKAQYVIEINDGANPNKIQLWYEADNDADTYVPSTTDIKTKRWYFFAATRNKAGVIKIYLDGKLETERKQPIPPASINHILTIGCRTNSPNTYQDFFHGFIDEVRVSDVARTADEIKDSLKGFFAVEPKDKLATRWGYLKSLSGNR